MKPKSFMVIAGETSGDMLAAELVQALRREINRMPAALTWDYQPLHASLEPRFYGAGGPQMAKAGVDLAFDLTAHAVTGISDVIKNYAKFRRFFNQLCRLAREREPDAIVCVDFSGFNRRFAHAIRQHVRARQDWFHDWNPKIIQYVSPQVWASREKRAHAMAQDFDLLLSIIPFERDWYAKRVPGLPVEFIGNSIVDRYQPVTNEAQASPGSNSRTILLLPGSRRGELQRHLPVMFSALEKIRERLPQVQARMVLSDAGLLRQAQQSGLPTGVQAQVGDLAATLRQTDLAIASTGTVTLECAYFGVPTIAMYKTSWFTWQVAKRIITVKYGAMPNLLADREIYPEFIQDAATAENIARTALDLLNDDARQKRIRAELMNVVSSLGPPGAAGRAAKVILDRLDSK